MTTDFWIALLQIVGVNIVLSGDNAVVIALAARSLPAKQQRQAVLWGSAAAVVMRIILTIAAVELLRLPYLKLVGAALLLYIGVQLLVPEEDHGEGKAAAAKAGMAAAIRTILLADLVMSLDNVIAVAAAAKGSLVLLIGGLLVSIPLVVFGSTFLMKFMERWPVIVTIGGGLLGWVAGEMAVTDPAVVEAIDAHAHWLHYVLPAAFAALVVAVGMTLAARVRTRMAGAPAIDLATADDQAVRTTALAEETAALRFLLVADDSAHALHAVNTFAEQIDWYRPPVEVHLLNTQRALGSDIAAFVPGSTIRDHHHEAGLKALQPARERLDRAGIRYIVHIGVGAPAQVIAHYAKETRCVQIFMSEHAGTVPEGLLGTVTTEVVRLSDAPVNLV
jgi:YjbE family integral membrane protein